MVLITKLQAARESLEFKTRRATTPRQQGAGHPFASQSAAKLLVPAAQQLGVLANALGPCTKHPVRAPAPSPEPGISKPCQGKHSLKPNLDWHLFS